MHRPAGRDCAPGPRRAVGLLREVLDPAVAALQAHVLPAAAGAAGGHRLAEAAGGSSSDAALAAWLREHVKAAWERGDAASAPESAEGSSAETEAGEVLLTQCIRVLVGPVRKGAQHHPGIFTRLPAFDHRYHG